MAKPSLRQLEYALSLAEHLNFGRAAKACGVSQPGLSSQILELEFLVGAALFERGGRQVLITEAGQRLLTRARFILEEVERLERETANGESPLCGKLRLGVIPTIAPYALPEPMRAVRKRYPNCKLWLKEAQTSELIDDLQKGRIDVALLALEVDTGTLERMPLYQDTFWLVIPKNHNLAHLKECVLSELASQEVLLLEDGHCFRDHALDLCRHVGAKEAGDFRATSLPTLLEMVAGGAGITILPEMSLKVELRAPRNLLAIPFTKPQPSRTIALVWRPGSPREQDFRLFGELMRSKRAASKR